MGIPCMQALRWKVVCRYSRVRMSYTTYYARCRGGDELGVIRCIAGRALSITRWAEVARTRWLTQAIIVCRILKLSRLD